MPRASLGQPQSTLRFMARCAVCEEEHDEVEPAFRRPDAFFAVPEPERATRIEESDDLVSIDDEAFFLRGVVQVPVLGREAGYAWGFWAKVAKAHFETYRRYFHDDPPPEHAGFPGTLANQTRWLPPTLGLPVHVHLGRGSSRPSFVLLDEGHELSRHQTHGVSEARVRTWSDVISNTHPPEPVLPPKEPRLSVEGWLVARPDQVGRPLHRITAPPNEGDLAKVPFVFRAADASGAVIDRVEYMWVELREVGSDGWWRGTLENHPFVPGPIDAGSAVWIRADHLLGFQRG